MIWYFLLILRTIGYDKHLVLQPNGIYYIFLYSQNSLYIIKTMCTFYHVNFNLICLVGTLFQESNIRHKDFRSSRLRPWRSDHPPWILKRGGLESSGQRLISSIGKTKIIAFFFGPFFFNFSGFRKKLLNWIFRNFFRFWNFF